MIIKDVIPYKGQHCETTATGTLLGHIGIRLSEPMLFGIGQGLGFIFWNMKMMVYPFIGGRIKPDDLTRNIAANLGLKLTVRETGSVRNAWTEVKGLLDRGRIVGLKLDCFHLEYFSNPIHFAGHYVAMYGYDDRYAYLVDTAPQGGFVRTSLKSLESARNEKGPMSSRNLYYTVSKGNRKPDLKGVIRQAIRKNAEDHLSPPISNIGYKGILKASGEIVKWFRTSQDVKRDFCTTAMLMEKAGTGGALFRNLYRDFLGESAGLLKSKVLDQAAKDFARIASLWTEVSSLFDSAGKTKKEKHVLEASALLKELSALEQTAMGKLRNL
jgi:hypothetical protein